MERDTRRIPNPADERLVRAASSGDEDARSELLHRLRFLRAVLERQSARLGSLVDADGLDDLAQDVQLVIWRKLERYRGDSPFEAWAYRICRLELLNTIRRREKQGVNGVELDAFQRAPSPGPWDYEEVHLGLESLPANEGAILRAKHFEGRTFEEIGEALGISTNTAKTRYYRGLARLEEYLEQRKMRDSRTKLGGPDGLGTKEVGTERGF